MNKLIDNTIPKFLLTGVINTLDGMGLYTALNYLGQSFFAIRTNKSEDADDLVAD